MLTHGNFMFELGVAVAELGRAVRRRRGASTLLFLPLAHVFARIIQVGCVKARARLGHSADIKNLRRRPRRVPADVHPRRAAGVREGLQHRLPAGHRRRPRQDLRPRRRDRDRLLPRPRRAAGPPLRGPRPARASSTGSSTPSCATRSAAACAYAVSGGAPLGERLGHFYRGIGLTVLEGYGLTETTAALTVNLPDAHQDRHRRPAAAGHRGPGRRRRRAAVPRRPGLRRLLAQRGGHRRGPRARRLVPHRRRRRGRRRGLRPDHRPQEGDPGDRRRQERRPGRARGPDARARRWSASAWSSATASRSSPRWSPSTRGVPGLGRGARQVRHDRRPGRRPRPARRGPGGGRRRQRRSPRPRRSGSSRSCPTTGPRRAASSRPASSSSATS